MMARYILVYNHPERGEQRFELDNDRSYRIGSNPDSDIVLRQNDVSRDHAILRVRDGAFNITDLNSKNGTYVNGQRTAAASVKCGDLINVSSARLVVVEVASGAYSGGGEAQTDSSSGGRQPLREDTLGYSGEASAEDMISLLITTSSAVRRGALAEPLTWAVDRFGLQAVAVLYRDQDDNVAMVSSAGDLGPLVRSSGTLARLVREQKGYRAGTRIQQVSALGETLLVAPIQRDHVLVVRFEGPPPAIGDIRAVIAAVEAVLCSGNPPSPDGTTERRDPEARQFGSPMQRIAGLSDSIVECKRRMAELARRSEPVLITGEAGSGKSLFARVLHDLSPIHEEEFVVFDCGRERPDRIEELLFGDPVGDGDPGAVERAAGGTLYLKSVCEVPIELQARLLDQLRSGEVDTPGVRMLAGSRANLDLAVAEGRLRQDLLSALGGLRIDLPPLRERSEDIPLLVTVFQREGGARRQRTGGFTVDALEALAHHQWPHNVAELRREVLRLVTNTPEESVIEISDLAPHITEALAGHSVRPPDLGALAQRPLAEARADFERWRILRALHDSGGNQSQAAMDLGLSRAGLFKKMRRLGLTANH
jgi:DNA-binding NtrC family response regulator/pSer/pThr/pTyr-binding forkhead associated (FHA) protein